MNNNTIQKYINEFRRHITSILKPNIGLEIDIYNCGNEGAVLVVLFKPGDKSIDKEINEFDSISAVLNSIDQNFIGGNVSGITFGGTNMMMDGNRIIIVKDRNENEWSTSKLKEDIDKIIQPPSKTRQV